MRNSQKRERINFESELEHHQSQNLALNLNLSRKSKYKLEIEDKTALKTEKKEQLPNKNSDSNYSILNVSSESISA